MNRELESEPNFKPKKLSASARNLLLRHSWPGNVRELLNTLRSATVWASGETIGAESIRESIAEPEFVAGAGDPVLGRSLDEPIDLQELLDDVAQHYLKRALTAAGGNKSRAASLVGFKHYQTFSNWLEKYRIGK